MESLLRIPKRIEFLFDHAPLQVEHVLAIAVLSRANRQALRMLPREILSDGMTPGFADALAQSLDRRIDFAGLFFLFAVAAVFPAAFESAFAAQVVQGAAQLVWRQRRAQAFVTKLVRVERLKRFAFDFGLRHQSAADQCLHQFLAALQNPITPSTGLSGLASGCSQ